MRLTSPRDGQGHGDLFSAFSLALLIGHELAGKKPYVVESLLNYSVDTTSPMQRAIDTLAQQREEYDAEMKVIDEGGYDYDGREAFIEAMRQCQFGRI
jgi:hypothetical protein